MCDICILGANPVSLFCFISSFEEWRCEYLPLMTVVRIQGDKLYKVQQVMSNSPSVSSLQLDIFCS